MNIQIDHSNASSFESWSNELSQSHRDEKNQNYQKENKDEIIQEETHHTQNKKNERQNTIKKKVNPAPELESSTDEDDNHCDNKIGKVNPAAESENSTNDEESSDSNDVSQHDKAHKDCKCQNDSNEVTVTMREEEKEKEKHTISNTNTTKDENRIPFLEWFLQLSQEKQIQLTNYEKMEDMQHAIQIEMKSQHCSFDLHLMPRLYEFVHNLRHHDNDKTPIITTHLNEEEKLKEKEIELIKKK